MRDLKAPAGPGPGRFLTFYLRVPASDLAQIGPTTPRGLERERERERELEIGIELEIGREGEGEEKIERGKGAQRSCLLTVEQGSRRGVRG
jgi:hypothetical protein